MKIGCTAETLRALVRQTEHDQYPPTRHPVVRTHPFAGRKWLYVMRDNCVGIEDMQAG